MLFVQRYGRAMSRQAGAGQDGPRTMLKMLTAIAALEPSHTKRSEEQVRLQQFSTPLPLAYAALRAAAIRPGDTVLEPSAGTGMLAVMAECAMGTQAAGNLHLNEYAQTRARLVTRLFPQAVTTAFNAEAIADRLHDVTPTAVIMNPPFSSAAPISRSTPRASSAAVSPNGVNRTPVGRRSNSLAPKRASIRATVRVSAGWAIASRSAAAPIFPASATARNFTMSSRLSNTVRFRLPGCGRPALPVPI